MKKQFVRFYLLLLLSCAALLWALGSIVQLTQQEHWNYQLDAESLFKLQQQGQIIQQVPASSLYFPPELSALLRQQQIVAVDLPDGQSLYYRQSLQPTMLDQLGPLPTLSAANSSLPYLLYGALALLFLALLWPVFRDIRRLTLLTQQFAASPAPVQSQIHQGSSLYPLAQSMEQMASQISQMMAINQDMSRTIAHETRTPLARMKFTLSLAAQQLESRYQQRLLDDIEEIDALVSNYLDFSKLDYFRHQNPLPCHKTADFMADLASRFDIYQHAFELSFQSQPTIAHFHYSALLLAGQNLLANAIRYAKGSIQVRFEQTESYYQLTVTDDGPGLEEHPDVLMRLFRRGGNSSGFGLGLYIVNKVAQWHQGEVRIHSTPSQGTCVSLRWPSVAEIVSDE
ncbi:HAMP domain-containing sensor histidine kinase [Rheinheimera sp. 1928-s]|uniref:sensor histidine kinase n=1 Tax=Rheinheimera sp. 1928-s TaxID=3033803 RepID=UPI00262629FB|nr:HAMP domain-containing sensor histidine kinase [Rheinheimera sp. 1928-s]MDF3123454.1 HAMP domain-containing sensor histidine kinase [Rheinheimera sp. 1928-s]